MLPAANHRTAPDHPDRRRPSEPRPPESIRQPFTNRGAEGRGRRLRLRRGQAGSHLAPNNQQPQNNRQQHRRPGTPGPTPRRRPCSSSRPSLVEPFLVQPLCAGRAATTASTRTTPDHGIHPIGSSRLGGAQFCFARPNQGRSASSARARVHTPGGPPGGRPSPKKESLWQGWRRSWTGIAASFIDLGVHLTLVPDQLVEKRTAALFRIRSRLARPAVIAPPADRE